MCVLKEWMNQWMSESEKSILKSKGLLLPTSISTYDILTTFFERV